MSTTTQHTDNNALQRKAVKPLGISNEMQTQLDMSKIQLQIDNELYIRKHPELKDIIRYVTREVLIKRPENVSELAIELFSDPQLRDHIAKFQTELPPSTDVNNIYK
ncbi:hypothetical protein BASA60_001183 [Batrachochytrium salamandrivorans]|nr:hypothetical protein BASA60_001183 [Batrachochytrium salamandrivorans]